MGKQDRDSSIDIFRGLTIVAMVIANYMEHIKAVPAWLKHAPDIGITVIDFIAPFFIFAVGLNAGASFQRRIERAGLQSAIKHVIKRGLALIGIGMLFSVGEASYGFSRSIVPWGTLQAIGAAVILSLPFLRIKPLPRLVSALVLLAAYQILLDHFWLKTVLSSSHAGLPGIFSWTALMIISSVFADWKGKPSRVWILTGLLLTTGVLLAFVIPVSKHRMSFSFVLITVSSASLVLGLIRNLLKPRRSGSSLLAIWGRNPLVLYILHLMLLAVFLVPSAPGWHMDAPLWQAAVQGLCLLGVIHLAAWGMHRKNLFISL